MAIIRQTEQEETEIENRLNEIESKIIEQEHRPFTLIWNFFNRNKWWKKSDPRHSAAAKALVWRLLFSPTTMALATGGFLGYLTLFFLYRQNVILVTQNEQIEKQTYLIESTRRGNYLFVLGDLLSDFNDEMNLPNNHEKIISNVLFNRIRSLARIIQPYHYLEDGEITKKLSPERALLLYTLLESEMDKYQLSELLDSTNFNYSDLRNATFAVYLKGVELRNSYLANSHFSNLHIDTVDFTNSDLSETTFIGCQISGTDFTNTNLSESKFIGATFYPNVSSSGSLDFSNAILDNVMVDRADWFEYMKDTIKAKGITSLQSKYKVIQLDSLDTVALFSHPFRIVRKEK